MIKIPYGVSNFRKIIESEALYVEDIKKMENLYSFLIIADGDRVEIVEVKKD